MSLFQWRFLRRIVRKRTGHIPEDTATVWKRRLAFGYAIVAWNALAIIGYMIYNGKLEFDKAKKAEDAKVPPAKQFARQFRIKEAKVFRITGLNVSKYDIDNTDEEASETENAGLNIKS